MNMSTSETSNTFSFGLILKLSYSILLFNKFSAKTKALTARYESSQPFHSSQCVTAWSNQLIHTNRKTTSSWPNQINTSNWRLVVSGLVHPKTLLNACSQNNVIRSMLVLHLQIMFYASCECIERIECIECIACIACIANNK